MASIEPPVSPAEAQETPELGLAEVYQAHFQYVWHAVRRLGGREADLEDLVHDVFMTFWKSLERYDTSRALKPWLYGIAFRVVSDYRRRARFSREIPSSDKQSAVASQAPAPLQEYEARQRRRLVQDGLDTLSMDQRAVFVMVEIEGYSVVEAAEALDLKLNTTYSRLRLGRAKFTAAVKRLVLRRGDS